MITLNLLKQKRAHLCVGLFLAGFVANAQEPVATTNTEITGVTLDYYFHQEPDTANPEDGKETFAVHILDGDIATTWAGNVTELTTPVDPILTFNLNGAHDLAEIQYLTVSRQYLFQVWVSTTDTDDYTEATFVNITPSTGSDIVEKNGESNFATKSDATYTSFDLSSNPGVTFVNIYCSGRTDSDWNTIADLKFYERGATASTRDNKLSNSLIYPNPASENVFLTNLHDDVSKVEVLNLQGKVLLSQKIGNTNSVNLNTATLTNGVYFVNLSNSANTLNASKTIIVQH